MEIMKMDEEGVRWFLDYVNNLFVFLLFSFYTNLTNKEKKSEPTEMLQLDGYTVDYIEAASGKDLLIIAHQTIN